MSHSLPRISVSNERFDAEILLQGAQLMHFAPRGQKPWIFQNAQTPFTPAREIYAGVPLAFPWFNRLKQYPKAPNHGFARQAQWEVEHQSEDGSRVVLVLSSEAVREQGFESSAWSGEFEARMSFSFGKSLGMRFEVTNIGTEVIRFECAMHPYFAVSDARATRVEGVPDGVDLEDGDSVQGGTLEFPPFGARLFVDSQGPVVIREPERNFRISNRAGWRSSVVWNPGKGMGDLIESDWPNFVCVEAGALRGNAVTLSAGESYALDIEIELD